MELWNMYVNTLIGQLHKFQFIMHNDGFLCGN